MKLKVGKLYRVIKPCCIHYEIRQPKKRTTTPIDLDPKHGEIIILLCIGESTIHNCYLFLYNGKIHEGMVGFEKNAGEYLQEVETQT